MAQLTQNLLLGLISGISAAEGGETHKPSIISVTNP
jgi:hypothetical protein